jgi:hypothetical protein
VPQHGGLQAAEAEIETVLAARRVAIRMREPGRRKADCVLVALLREAIDDGSARISETEQLCHLVIRFTRGIVSRTANWAVNALFRD